MTATNIFYNFVGFRYSPLFRAAKRIMVFDVACAMEPLLLGRRETTEN